MAAKPIAWGELDASGLDEAKRRIVGESWKERAKQEHLAIGAFALLARELAAEGCDPVVLGLVTKASWDEARHADICRKMAIALLGEEAVPTRYKGLPKVPMHANADDATRVLLHVVEMCCLSETLTGVFFTEMLARTTNPIVRRVISSLLEDELDHGRVGWAYLATRHREGTLDGLAEALPAMMERTVERARVKRAGAADDPSMEAFGFLGNLAGRAAVERALADVIAPGFATFGLSIAITPSR